MERNQIKLTIPLEEAEKKINIQIQKGKEIKDAPINSQESLDRTRAELTKWSEFNATLLDKIFNSIEVSNKYQGIGAVYGSVSSQLKRPTLAEFIQDFRKFAQERIDKLESIRNRLELYVDQEQEEGRHDDEAKVIGAKQLKLTISQAEAREKISNQVEKGRSIRDTRVDSLELLEEAKAEYRLWDADSFKMLKDIFNASEMSEQYGAPTVIEEADALFGEEGNWDDRIRNFRGIVTEKIGRLFTLMEHLGSFEEMKSADSSKKKKRESQRRFFRKVFGVLFQYFSVGLIFFLFIIGRNAFSLDYLTFAGIFIAILLGALVVLRLLKPLQVILIVVFAFILIILLRPSPL